MKKQYKRINDYTFIGNDGTVKVIIDGITYKSCAFCGRFFIPTGNRSKYCPHCRQKINSMKTSQNYHNKMG